jgi:hypothetical protein
MQTVAGEPGQRALPRGTTIRAAQLSQVPPSTVAATVQERALSLFGGLSGWRSGAEGAKTRSKSNHTR